MQQKFKFTPSNPYAYQGMLTASVRIRFCAARSLAKPPQGGLLRQSSRFDVALAAPARRSCSRARIRDRWARLARRPVYGSTRIGALPSGARVSVLLASPKFRFFTPHSLSLPFLFSLSLLSLALSTRPILSIHSERRTKMCCPPEITPSPNKTTDPYAPSESALTPPRARRARPRRPLRPARPETQRARRRATPAPIATAPGSARPAGTSP